MALSTEAPTTAPTTATADNGAVGLTIISADCHAGGSHAQYREYLDPAYLEDFDAWRAKYKNPFRDLGDNRRLRNWDNEMRNSQQEADGVVGEVLFPNTVPPFFPSFVLFAPPPPPEDYQHRLAGIRAHNRWLVDWCNEFPERRAGIGQIFLNDVDDAIADVRWIKEHGLRGGVLLPNPPPDVTWVKPLYDPYYEPLWAVCEELEIPVHSHGGIGVPDYGSGPLSMVMYITEVGFYSQRPFVHLLLSGVFERHPRLKFVMTEMGAAWLPPLLDRLDGTLKMIRGTGAQGELRFDQDQVLPKSASEYFAQNCWVGMSQPDHRRRQHPPPAGDRPAHVGLGLPPRRGHLPVDPGEPPGRVLRPRAGRPAKDPQRERRRPLRLRPRGSQAPGGDVRPVHGRAGPTPRRPARQRQRGPAPSREEQDGHDDQLLTPAGQRPVPVPRVSP